MPPKTEAPSGVEDPFNIINTARVRKGKISKHTTEEIPWNAFSSEPFEKKKAKDRDRRRRPQKLHPLLQSWLDAGRGSEREELLVAFRDDLTIPRFPDPVPDEDRKSAANRRALRAAQQLVAEITESRAKRYEELERELRAVKAKPLERFWLVNAVLVDMPLGAAARWAERDDVLFIAPRSSGEEPPQNPNQNDDVDDGRARIVSDPYFNLGLRGGWIGLLDTGLRFTHTQFNSPSHIAFRRDCVNGGATCTAGPGFNPNDDCWNHGTKTAGIITGNANSGAPFRGVTAITLDSFKVYPAGCGGLDQAAVLRAFQVAVAVLDRVIVAEMQGGGDDLSPISTAADAAFDAGAVVIAANGNNGPGASTVNTPANGHRTIGVGNFDVQTQAQIPGQSRGPAPDGRYKPDIQAPTQTETASSASDTALASFGGTSGATPYAAGPRLSFGTGCVAPASASIPGRSTRSSSSRASSRTRSTTRAAQARSNCRRTAGPGGGRLQSPTEPRSTSRSRSAGRTRTRSTEPSGGPSGLSGSSSDASRSTTTSTSISSIPVARFGPRASRSRASSSAPVSVAALLRGRGSCGFAATTFRAAYRTSTGPRTFASRLGGGTPRVYADNDWYEERPEEELEWKGVLRRRELVVGPDNRTALTYALVTSDGELDVYAAGAEAILAPLEHLRVVARGKLVDLSGEGHGSELWLASVESAPGA